MYSAGRIDCRLCRSGKGPHMIPVTINRTTRQLATSWDELTQRQWLRVVGINQRVMTEQVRQLRLFAALFIKGWWDVRGQWAIWRLMRELDRLDELTRLELYGELHEVLRLVEPLYQDLAFTRNPLPVICIRKGWRRVKLYGPANGLAGITGGEFAWAEKKLLAWHDDQNLQHLAELAAILWRPKRDHYDPLRHDDIRVPFRPAQIESLSRYTQKLRPEVLHAVRLIYRHGRDLRVNAKGNKRIFDAEQEEQSRKKSYGWLGIWLELGQGVLTMEQVAAQPLDLLLLEINRLMDRKAEVEAEVKKNKRS